MHRIIEHVALGLRLCPQRSCQLHACCYAREPVACTILWLSGAPWEGPPDSSIHSLVEEHLGCFSVCLLQIRLL